MNLGEGPSHFYNSSADLGFEVRQPFLGYYYKEGAKRCYWIIGNSLKINQVERVEEWATQGEEDSPQIGIHKARAFSIQVEKVASQDGSKSSGEKGGTSYNILILKIGD